MKITRDTARSAKAPTAIPIITGVVMALWVVAGRDVDDGVADIEDVSVTVKVGREMPEMRPVWLGSGSMSNEVAVDVGDWDIVTARLVSAGEVAVEVGDVTAGSYVGAERS